MSFQDSFMSMYMLNSFKDLTGDKFFDTIIVLILSTLYFTDRSFLNNIFNKIRYNLFSVKNEIKICGKKEEFPLSLKAILWYIANNTDISISKIELLSNHTWDRYDNKIEKEKIYIINQPNIFQINDDIYGIMRKYTEEEARTRDHSIYKNIYELRIFSDTKSVSDLLKWSENIVKDYRNYTKLKTIENQLLLSVSYNEKLMIESCEFDSTATFENTYVPNYEEIYSKINFFLNNKEWYNKKGIPYNLGIILYGEPGCGKTRFIKQLMNLTKRHGIDIKLNNKFDFNVLKDIIHNENISDDYIIPQDKRIIIFEDIDAMCDILKDRDLENKDEKDNVESKLKKMIESNSFEKIKNSSLLENKENNNNNLSYFLNIIDGLNECSGRIIVMTTNKIDYLDKAIIRPGRIDIMINFTKYSKKDVCGLINKFWNKNFDEYDIDSSVHQKYTSAELISIFRKTSNFDDIKHLFINY